MVDEREDGFSNGQLLAHGQWFSPGTQAPSTTKIGRHDIAEILLKVALNTINQTKSNHNRVISLYLYCKQGMLTTKFKT
jgi:hypothetical protein